jgi:hypothetical protein
MISRTKLKCSKSDIAMKRLIGIINKEASNKSHAIFMIEEAIVRGWKSLFPVEYKIVVTEEECNNIAEGVF